MEPTALEHQSQSAAPKVRVSSGFLRRQLTRTTDAFTAEYSVFLLSLGTVLGNLIWLVFIFFGMVVDSMNGGTASAYVSLPLATLWFLISSLVSLPLAAALWSRTDGELASNKSMNGELTKGAKGFRTFWIVVAMIIAVGLKVFAIFAPLAALTNSVDVAQALLGVTVPALLGAGILYVGIYIVTRRTNAHKMIKMLMWGVVVLTAVLFATDYIWARNMPSAPTSPQIYSAPVYPDGSYTNPYVNPPYTY